MAVRPTFFANASDFRSWLVKHHATHKELLVGYYKVATGKPSMTWSESVDEALCFGWIDGVRRTFDEHSYTIRFTPRKPTSTWSEINIRKMKSLIREKRVSPAGLKAYRARSEKKSGTYSYEQRRLAKLDRTMEREFRAKAAAWRYFQSQAPWYRRTCIWWIVSAKREATRHKRLRELIEASEKERPIDGLDRSKETLS
jgi:uncharacterized protein YdeI (YjbR/CyaY-like superfamily)